MMRTLRFRWLVDEVDERNSESVDYPLMSVSQYLGVVPRSELKGDQGRAESLANYKICRPGEIVINRMSAASGALGIAKSHGLVSPDYAVLKVNELAHPQFIEYLMKSSWFVGEMVSRLRGIGAGGESASVRTPRININDLGNILVDLPPKEVQCQIADYLDFAANKIDLMRSQILRLVELLDEFFSNQLAALFDSSSGKSTPLRRLARLVNGGTPDPSEDNWMGQVPWATPVDLGRANGKNISETDRMLTEKGLLTGSRLIPAGSLIISTRAPIGYIAINTLPMAFNQGCKGVVINSDVDINYLQFALLSKVAELQSLGTGSTFMELSNDALKSIPVRRRESLEEEKEVSDFISKLQTEVQTRKALLATEIELLQEYKTSLITDAVTGNFELTTGRSLA